MKVNIFIDGTWLFKVQDKVLKKARIASEAHKPISIDFNKLSNLILKHVKDNGHQDCDGFGERHCCISVLQLPNDLDTWKNKKVWEIDGSNKTNNYILRPEDVKRTRTNSHARKRFAERAIKSGFENSSVLTPNLKAWMVQRLSNGTFQEKQVDTTVVALLVKSAITKSEEIHVVIAGDADILPAIKIAYPEFSKKIMIVTTHPDELKAEHRQSSYSYQQEDFEIPALYLQDHVKDIMEGNAVQCPNCHGIFVETRNLPKGRRSYCHACESERT